MGKAKPSESVSIPYPTPPNLERWVRIEIGGVGAVPDLSSVGLSTGNRFTGGGQTLTSKAADDLRKNES